MKPKAKIRHCPINEFELYCDGKCVSCNKVKSIYNDGETNNQHNLSEDSFEGGKTAARTDKKYDEWVNKWEKLNDHSDVDIDFTNLLEVTGLSAKEYINKNFSDAIYRIDQKPAPVEVKDSVNHPSHYGGQFEVIDILKDKLTVEQFYGFLCGNVMKYIMRYQQKNGIEDLKKAQWYLNYLIEEMEPKDE